MYSCKITETHGRASLLPPDNWILTSTPWQLKKKSYLCTLYWNTYYAKTACKIASEAFDVAIHQLEKIEDEQYKDSTTILQLLKENIDMWKADLQEQEEDGDDGRDD